MKKILINRKIVTGPYGGGNNFLKSIHDFLLSKNHCIVYDLSHKDIDLIIMHDPRYDELGISVNEIAAYKRAFPKTRVLHRINECDARKGTNDVDKLLMISNSIADETVFISKWLEEYFTSRGFNKRSNVIYNGCNSSYFYPKNNLEKSSLDYPVKIVTHHWSDNWMKGFDAYQYLDEICKKNPQKYQFTYVGRYAKQYSPVATKLVEPLHGKELGDELRKHDVYITASRWEPCGMHHIEGAASGLPILYHSEGGGIVEGCQNHGMAFSNVEEIITKLDDLLENYSSVRSKIDYEFLSIDRCIKDYYSIIEKMLLG
jgi:glycosyltransferase involved in cell wall biosynthesis